MAILAEEIVKQRTLTEDGWGPKPEGDKNFASQLPEPRGYKLLITLPEIGEKTEGGIIKSSESRHEESIATVVGWVMSMGPDAYTNYARFPSGPYC